MRTFLFVFAVSFCLHVCCGRYRGVPFRELSQSDEEKHRVPCYKWSPGDELLHSSKKTASAHEYVQFNQCADDPDYAEECEKMARYQRWCSDQENTTRELCAKSCKWCSGEKAPSPIEETVEPSTAPKPPAPAVCEDDPDYASGCPGFAKIENYCKDQEKFMRKNCPRSCNFCEEEETVEPKPPAPTEETVEPSTTPKPPAPPVCEDKPKWASRCPKWAKEGSCIKAKVFMRENCHKSCNFTCEPEPTSNPETKPPSPPAFCRDRDVNCIEWQERGDCDNPNTKLEMKIYCAVTCDFCKAPTPEECYDKIANCQQLKENGDCTSTVPRVEYEVKTNCLETCEFCVPELP